MQALDTVPIKTGHSKGSSPLTLLNVNSLRMSYMLGAKLCNEQNRPKKKRKKKVFPSLKHKTLLGVGRSCKQINYLSSVVDGV